MKIDKKLDAEIKKVTEARVKNKALEEALTEIFSSSEQQEPEIRHIIDQEKQMLKQYMRDAIRKRFK